MANDLPLAILILLREHIPIIVLGIVFGYLVWGLAELIGVLLEAV